MPSEFLTPLVLRAYAPGEWILEKLFAFQAADGNRHYVPPRFITDLASIPRALRGVYDVTGRSRGPAVLHDYAYCVQRLTRAQADALFLEALATAGVGPAVRWSMWLGVRMGGWAYWRKRKGSSLEGDFYHGQM